MCKAPLDSLNPSLLAAARAIATTLASAGMRGWIVGGAVRDLLMNRVPNDVDMVSAARPDQVEALFPKTYSVGRAFGIVVVQIHGVDVELATFRTESGYSDARHPDRIQYAETPELDALRRDFSCNALYLDPLTGELLDPCGGVEDIQQGELRTVGSAQDRFTEDGLRLLRMGRFAGQLGFLPSPDVLQAARDCKDSLAHVSPERIRSELSGCLDSLNPSRALQCLLDGGLLPVCLPWLCADGADPATHVGLLKELGEHTDHCAGWAVLLGHSHESIRVFEERAHGLRFSRADVQALVRTLNTAALWCSLSGQDTQRSTRILALRDEPWEGGYRLARARARQSGDVDLIGEMDELAHWRRGLSHESMFPPALLRSADLRAASVPRGPRWAELFDRALRDQLDQKLLHRSQLTQWLVDAGHPDTAP